MGTIRKMTPQEKEDLKLVRKIKKIERLMQHFDATAFAFKPGVRCYIPGDGNWFIDFDKPTWKFIEPLLKELLYLRMSRLRRLNRSMEERRMRK